MNLAVIGLTVAEYVITFGLKYLVKHEKFGIGHKLAKVLIEAAVKSKENPVEQSMVQKALDIL